MSLIRFYAQDILSELNRSEFEKHIAASTRKLIRCGCVLGLSALVCWTAAIATRATDVALMHIFLTLLVGLSAAISMSALNCIFLFRERRKVTT